MLNIMPTQLQIIWRSRHDQWENSTGDVNFVVEMSSQIGKGNNVSVKAESYKLSSLRFQLFRGGQLSYMWNVYRKIRCLNLLRALEYSPRDLFSGNKMLLLYFEIEFRRKSYLKLLIHVFFVGAWFTKKIFKYGIGILLNDFHYYEY